MTKTSPIQTANRLIERLILSQELDQLHLDLISLTDMIKEKEISLVLNQASKTVVEKKHFLGTIINSLKNEQLRKYLRKQLTTSGLNFFTENDLTKLLKALQKTAQNVKVINLTVAIHFSNQDLQDMAQLASHRLQTPAVLNLKVEPSLIGGAIVKYGKINHNNSIRQRLDQIQNSQKPLRHLVSAPQLEYKKSTSPDANHHLKVRI